MKLDGVTLVGSLEVKENCHSGTCGAQLLLALLGSVMHVGAIRTWVGSYSSFSLRLGHFSFPAVNVLFFFCLFFFSFHSSSSGFLLGTSALERENSFSCRSLLQHTQPSN